MPSQGTLLFLCSCLHPFPYTLGFANVVDLRLEYMCLHTKVECVLFEAETGSHDNCLSETVDFALMVDMSLRLEDGHSHIYDSQRVSTMFPVKLSYYLAEQGHRDSNEVLVVQALRSVLSNEPSITTSIHRAGMNVLNLSVSRIASARAQLGAATNCW